MRGFPYTAQLGDNIVMEFYADADVLDFLDDELLGLRDEAPGVLSAAVFETTSGAQRQLAALEGTHLGGSGDCWLRPATTFESESVLVAFWHDPSTSDPSLAEALFRTAKRIRVVLQPHLDLHTERERRDLPRRPMRSRSRSPHACPS